MSLFTCVRFFAQAQSAAGREQLSLWLHGSLTAIRTVSRCVMFMRCANSCGGGAVRPRRCGECSGSHTLWREQDATPHAAEVSAALALDVSDATWSSCLLKTKDPFGNCTRQILVAIRFISGGARGAGHGFASEAQVVPLSPALSPQAGREGGQMNACRHGIALLHNLL